MPVQPAYKTTTTGSIDHAYYDRRARAIRNRDLRHAIASIGRACKAIVMFLKRKTIRTPQPMAKSPKSKVHLTSTRHAPGNPAVELPG